VRARVVRRVGKCIVVECGFGGSGEKW